MTDKLHVWQKNVHTIKFTPEQLARLVGDRMGLPADVRVEVCDEDGEKTYGTDFTVRWYSEVAALL